MNYQKTESEMHFSFPLDSVLDLEKNEPYLSLVKGKGIKVCDFVFIDQKKRLLLIEAKKSSPNPSNPESKEKVAEYTHEIHMKMVHSLFLLIGMAGMRNYNIHYQRPEWISKTIEPSSIIIPVLVVKTLEKGWVPSLSDSLRKILSGTRKAYNLEDVLVMNESMAREKGYLE